MTAILKVIRRFESHRQAAKWYEKKGVDLPSNCMVPENHPLNLDRTSNRDNWPTVQRWDAVYRMRTNKTPVFLACEALFLELDDPPVVTEELFYDVFAKIPATRNPPEISKEEFEKLTMRVGVS